MLERNNRNKLYNYSKEEENVIILKIAKAVFYSSTTCQQ